MKISTIIPAFRCAPYLRRAVESLLATNYSDLEIIIAEDGSRDGTLDMAEALQQEHPDVVRLVHHPGHANRGVSASRNLGIQTSTGEWLSFLDADDYVYPHRFESARALLSQHPEVGGVYQLCDLKFADLQAQQNWWNDARTTFGFTEPIAPSDLIFELLRGRCWATSAIVVRRSLLEQTGLFEPRLKIAEDCHLWFRLAVTGTLIAGDLSQAVSAYWRHSDSAYQPSPHRRLEMIRAMASFVRWLRTHAPHDTRLPAITQSVAHYILGGIAEARTKGQRRLAWSLALRSVREFPRLSVYRPWYGHLVRLTAGR